MPKGDIKMQWTPQSEQLIRQYFNGKEELKVLSTDEKDKFNTCVINKLKVLFPKGLTKIPEKEAVKIGEECIKEILDNNEKP
jgi:hypothetical protein